MKLTVIISLLLILVLAGCLEPETSTYESSIGKSCSMHSECKTPMEYAVQSNCPFGAACIESTCKVICPLSYHDPNPNISKTYPFSCNSDSDCDCSERGSFTIECICLDGSCVSVEAE